METWDLAGVVSEDGSTPVVLASEDGARAIAVLLGPGEELGEHQVRERAWLLVVEGEVRVEVRGARLDVGPGRLVTFDPGERHTVRAPSGARLLLLLSPWPAPGHYRLDEHRR